MFTLMIEYEQQTIHGGTYNERGQRIVKHTHRRTETGF